jgi:uncharacterized membrane protein (UPF0127 family)
MRWASSSQKLAAILAAFFFLALPSPAGAAESGSAQILPLDPQPLVIATRNGPKSFSVEIADDDSERSIGMMFRTSAPQDRAMLFDFGQTRMVTIWMRNTFVPLDIIFISDDMRIVKISPNAVPHSEELIGSGEPVRFALELAAGKAQQDGILVGDLVQHPAITRALSGEPAK